MPTTYSSNGTPSDNVGVAGDFNIDYGGKFLWGPRGSSSWAGTASSIVGPTGPAMMTGSGPPSNAVGGNGQGYTDLSNGQTYIKAAGAWALAGSIVGPSGAPGISQPAFGQFASPPGPGAYANGFPAQTDKWVTMNVGSVANQPSQFVPLTDSAFMGATIFNPGSITISVRLLNLTTNTTVWFTSGASLPAISAGLPSTTQYPMPKNNTYVWQMQNTDPANVYVVPYYLMQCGASQGCGTYPPFTLSATTLTSTAVAMKVSGFTVAMTYRSPRVGYLYGMTVQASGSASAVIGFAGMTTTAVTSANSPMNFGPFPAANYVLAANTNFNATVTGSGTGDVIMTPTIVQ